MKILVACYTVLAIAAGSRAAVQLATKASDAPLPYALSAVAALVYLVLAVSLRRDGRWLRIGLAAATIELIGVLTVGTAELSSSTRWPDETVWSSYGSGYGFAPLILPIIAIAVLINHARQIRVRPRVAAARGPGLDRVGHEFP